MKHDGNRGQPIRGNPVWVSVILIGLSLMELWGSYQLYSRGLWARIIRVESLQSLLPLQPIAREYFQEKIKKEPWTQSRDSKAQCLGALRWTMNQARKVALNPNNSNPVDLLKSVEAGEGALCDDMANLFQNTLAALGITSRKVWLFRDLMIREDTHSTVEVWLDGKWVIMCPTFGVSFRDNGGGLLAAQDMKEYLFLGRTAEVTPVFYGEAAYPARIEKYYMNFWVFYNNVFVVEQRRDLPGVLPPFCYFFGTRLYYEKLPYESDTHLQFIRQLFFIWAIIIPGLWLFFFSYGVYLFLQRRAHSPSCAFLKDYQRSGPEVKTG